MLTAIAVGTLLQLVSMFALAGIIIREIREKE